MALFDSQAQLLAAQFLAAEPPEKRALRLWARELWDAADALAPEGDAPSPAQVVLHRDAVARILREHQPAGYWAGRSRLEDMVAAPGSAEAGAMLRNAHRIFLGELEAPLTAARAARVRRWVSTGVALFTAAAVVVLLVGMVQWARRPVDLAKGKPFTLSSKWTDCSPEKGECGGFPMKIFFHTQEQAQPWFQWDLQKPATFSSMTIKNRSDVAMMRAVPLVVEVSDDGQAFREVARRTEHFAVWEPKFAPQTARYVRLRVDRTSTLHLEAAQVHP